MHERYEPSSQMPVLRLGPGGEYVRDIGGDDLGIRGVWLGVALIAAAGIIVGAALTIGVCWWFARRAERMSEPAAKVTSTYPARAEG